MIDAIKSYPGRKGGNGTHQKIIEQIPRCQMFIDAMCGSAFIGSMVKVSSIVINDIDKSLIDKINYTAGPVTKLNIDYKKLIKKYDDGRPGRVFYFDPPYMMQTRSYKKPIYKYEWTDKDHKTFLSLMLKMKCPTIVSHYPCPLYDRVLKKWRQVTYNSMTRAGVRKERIYMNFPQPVLLQMPGVVGKNFTDRQRIKRKVERQIKSLEKESPQERAAILSSIIARFDYVISTP